MGTWILALCLVSVFISASPSSAQAVADTRTAVTIDAYLDEPSLAFAGRQLDVLTWLDHDAGDTRRPTGTLSIRAHEPGAAVEVQRLDGTEENSYLPVTPTRAGTRYYTIEYSGDRYFKPARVTNSYQVWTGPETKTTLTASTTGPVTVSKPVTFTAQVKTRDGGPLTGTSDGPIEFYADGEYLGEGTEVEGSRGWRAQLTLDYLPVGRHKITAVHASTLRYVGPASNPVYLTVKAAANAAAVSGTHTVSTGDRFDFLISTVTVRPAQAGGRIPTGYVQFYSDGAKDGLPVRLVNGAARYDYLPVGAGSHTFRAEYLGDTRYRPTALPTRTVTVPGS